MPTALVTGATSGIGLELATLLARDGHDVALVARTKERLDVVARGLSEEFGIRAMVLPSDLALPEAPAEIFRELEKQAVSVDVLVNDAGFGIHGRFSATPLELDLAMIQVNISAVTELAHRALTGMVERRRGRILNVASTAAFQAGPLMAVYYATKAYVLSFSEALSNELSGTGVTVTALCPGPTITEFQKTAGVADTALFTGPLVMDAATVARAGYRAMRRGQRLVIPGVGNNVLVQALRVSPRRIAL